LYSLTGYRGPPGMTKTTIELTKEQKQMLQDERLDHESNYGETIERLCGNGYEYATKGEVREIVQEEITERIVSQAQK